MEFPKDQYIEEAFTNFDNRVDNIYKVIQNFCDCFDDTKINSDFFERCTNSLQQQSDKNIFDDFISTLSSIFDFFSDSIQNKDLLTSKNEFNFIIEQMQEQLNLLQREIEQLKNENAHLKDTKSYENSEMANQIDQSNIEKLYQEIENLKDQNYKQQKQILSLDKENANFLTQFPKISEEASKYKNLYAKIYSDKNRLEEENKALQDEISSLRVVIDEYSSQDQSEFNSEKIDELNKVIENLNKEIEKLNDDGFALLSEYNSLKSNNENLIKSYNELTNEKNILNNKISEFNQNNKQLFEENKSLKEKVDYYKNEGQELYDKYSLILAKNESFQQTITKKEQDIQKLNGDTQKLNKDIQILNDKNKNLINEISSFNKSIKSINNDKDNLKTQNESLSNDLNKSLIEKADLENQLKQKNEDINFLKLSIENKDSTNQELNTAILNLSSEKDTLNKKVTSLNKTIESQREIIRKQMILAKNENERQIAQIKEIHNKEIKIILETLL